MSGHWTAFAVGAILGVAASFLLAGGGGAMFTKGEVTPTDQNKRAGWVPQ